MSLESLTHWLNHLGDGELDARSEVLDELYAELHQLAQGHMGRQASGHTLQPTALVSEAWLRISAAQSLHFDTRAQFFALAGKVMRTVLVELRFFGGLDHPFIARIQGRSLRAVERSWRLAKAWLHGELTK
jgi:hypothetical protein